MKTVSLEKAMKKKIYTRLTEVVTYLGHEAIEGGDDSESPIELAFHVLTHLQEGHDQGHSLMDEEGNIKLSWDKKE
jgi:hypothetical protein